jgi:hypothetical protein
VTEEIPEQPDRLVSGPQLPAPGPEIAAPGDGGGTTNADLIEELRRTRKAVVALTEDAHRSKKLALISIVMAAVVVLVVAGGAFGFVRLAHTEATAQAARQGSITNRQDAVRQCEQQNSTRLQTIGLWQFIFGLFPKPAPGSAGDKLDQKFFTHLDHVYAPRSCSPANLGS